LQYSKSRDLKPSRPRLAKTGLETSLETETKSRDSITGNGFASWIWPACRSLENPDIDYEEEWWHRTIVRVQHWHNLL